jgi:CubicO group peptidase (beta-lactamase class C family)
MIQSVSKSMVSCVAAVLVGRGQLDVAQPLTAYVPEVSNSGYAGATVRDILDMRSGIAFNEVYLDPAADVRIFEKAIGWAPNDGEVPASLYEYLAALPAAREHGGPFEYRSCETDMLGWVLERASGTRMPTLLSQTLWARLGTEEDLDATVDRAGAVLHDGGFAVTLRDLGRFGQLVANDGRVGDQQVVPAEWFEDIRAGGPDSRAAYVALEGSEEPTGAMYRSQFWWPFADRDVVMCLGIHGQMVYIDRSRRFVAAKLSTTPLPWQETTYDDTVALMQQLVDLVT